VELEISVSDFLAETGAPLVNDDCAITITYQDVATSSCPVVIMRTFVLTDVCGNNTSCTQIITVDDTTAPLITDCPQNVTIQGCDPGVITGLPYSQAPAAVDAQDFSNAGGNASDLCGIVEYSYQDNLTGSCAAIVTRQWTLMDACGNTSTCDQTIEIYDSTEPAITCPADISVEGCDAADILNGNLTQFPYSAAETTVSVSEFVLEAGSPAASDNCGFSLTYQDAVSGLTCVVM
jgi:hypothetical protein